MIRRTVFLALLVLAAAAAGCAGRRGPPLDEAELRRRIAASAAERAGLRTFSAAGRFAVSGRRADGSAFSLSGSGPVLVEAGRALRARAEKALGLARLFDMAVADGAVRFYAVPTNKFYQGSVQSALRQPAFPPLPEELAGLDLAALLFPMPALDGPRAPEVILGARKVAVICRTAGGAMLTRTWLAADTAEALRTEFYGVDGRRLAVVLHEPPRAAGELHPAGGFSLRADGDRRLRLDVKFTDMEINAGLPPGAFELAVPRGAEVVDLDAPEKAGKAEAGRK